jgi:hypothetical protein
MKFNNRQTNCQWNFNRILAIRIEDERMERWEDEMLVAGYWILDTGFLILVRCITRNEVRGTRDIAEHP